jgi:pimeloyl-ACP methyl ester carboxylesterase
MSALRSARSAFLSKLLPAALLFAALSLFAFHFVRVGYRQCHPARTLVSPAEVARAREKLPGLEDVSFETRDALTLRGWFAPPKNGVAVILSHGLYANRALLLPEAEVMVRHGYGVLLYDSRAHGSSDGQVATWGSVEAFDIADAIRFVRSRPGVSRIALLGFSVGASATSRAAANDPSVGAVVLYATWTSLRAEIQHKVVHGGWPGAELMLLGMSLSGSQPKEIDPATDMARIAPRPILFLSGGSDDDTPPWVMDRLFAVAAQPKQLWREPSVGHGGYFEAAPAEYERRVIGFLDQAFP